MLPSTQGDVLRTTCTYNTEDRKQATVVSVVFASTPNTNWGGGIGAPQSSLASLSAGVGGLLSGQRFSQLQGGFSIMEEMCVNYLHYYPMTELELCKSAIDLGYVQRYFQLVNR